MSTDWTDEEYADCLYIEDIDSNDGLSIRLSGVKLTQTVEQLKRAIAVNQATRGNRRAPESIQVAFLGVILDNPSRSLSSYNIIFGDTLFFKFSDPQVGTTNTHSPIYPVQSWFPSTQVTCDKVRLDDLEVSFHRTIRVPDGPKSSALPPSLGKFPIYQVKDYVGKLPDEMAVKGGVFLPMYQREAMWIQLHSEKQYAIKIFVGGVNAVSGEPAIETPATKLRRRNLLSRNKLIQDYVVVPHQLWLDGIATSAGKVRQFVAMPTGSGYSVEVQVTGEEVTGGIQFEVVRPKRPPGIVLDNLYFMNYDGKKLALNHVNITEAFKHTKRRLEMRYGIKVEDARFIFNGKQLQDDSTLETFDVRENSVIHMVQRMLGGGYVVTSSAGYRCMREIEPQRCSEMSPEMGIAAGGFIDQAIIRDPKEVDWDTSQPKVFNVQILNSQSFRSVTGSAPPKTPIDASTYTKYGYPFFRMYEEATEIAGEFSMVKSVGQIDNTPEPSLGPHKVSLLKGLSFLSVGGGLPKSKIRLKKAAGKKAVIVNPSPAVIPKPKSPMKVEAMEEVKTNKQPPSIYKAGCGVTDFKEIGFFNPAGSMAPFRTLDELEHEVRSQGQVVF